MATNNSINTDIPIGADDGGTGRSSHTAYGVLCGGTTTTSAQQSIASIGTSDQVLTSNGAGALPTFQDAAGGGAAIEEKTSDYTANSTNSGKMWMRTDSSTALVKAVIASAPVALWSSGGNLSTARYGLAGCGTQSAGLSFGGTTGSSSAVTEEYNGTSWSAGGNLSTARRTLAGCGTQSAGLSFGGSTGSISAVTEEYVESSGYSVKTFTLT